MAHEIESTDGKHFFADSQSDAWHQLGQQVGHKMTPDEALTAAHMKGWNVRKVPLEVNIAASDDPELADMPPVPVRIPGKYTILRDNPVSGGVEPLGVIGRWWTPFQNEATAELLYNITDQGGAHIETIGSLDGGRRTFTTMKMPESMELTSPVDGSRDITDLYLAVINHHDGQGALRAIVSPIRIVCANTQRIAESMAVSQVNIRHTGEATVRLDEVRRILGITWRFQEVFAEVMARMAAVEVNEDQVRAAVWEAFDVNAAETDRQRDTRVKTASRVMEVYRQDVTVAPFKGTAFGGYNAVTRYLDHMAPLGAVTAGTRFKGSDADRRAHRTLTSDAVAGVKSAAFTALAAIGN